MTKKLSNKKGFTLAELLVVVAIIAVLVAVSIPIFSAQTKKANLATNQANARAAKAAAVSAVLGGSTSATFKYDIASGTITEGATASGTEITSDPSTWTDTGAKIGTLDTSVYKTWYVTVNNDSKDTVADGTVTSYSYDDAK